MSNRCTLCSCREATRRYELKERARRQEETRRRIVEATAALHEEVGPARTTVAEIARRAGVAAAHRLQPLPRRGRAVRGLLGALHGAAPDARPGPVDRIADPAARLRRALTELLRAPRRDEAMTANVLRDAETHAGAARRDRRRAPGLRAAVGEILLAAAACAGSASRRSPPPSASRCRSRPGSTSCRRSGLSPAEAVDTACAMVDAL